jgi:hypothetical protein
MRGPGLTECFNDINLHPSSPSKETFLSEIEIGIALIDLQPEEAGIWVKTQRVRSGGFEKRF